MKKNKRFDVLIAFFIFISVSGKCQSPVFNSVTPNSNPIAKLDKLELNISLTAAYMNAYDYEDISVQCIFIAPSGRKDTVDGFFMQDYTLNANGSIATVGSGSFKVRYTPIETGNWSYLLSCTNTQGYVTRPAESFQCIAASNHGFIRKNNSNYLSFDDSSQYIPIGENMSWQNGNPVTDYTNWLDKLSGNGGNFIRVWMCDWAFALEWKNGSNNFSGLKKYKQSSAFYLDWLLDYCKRKNIYMMLALNHHGQVSTTVNPEWNDNPYNVANGGPAANTWDFFTNATARLTHKNRLRYIIARYGYSQNIQSWELFNEVDWTDQFDSRKTDVKNWHSEMADDIKSKDVYKHLVTTSFGHDNNDDATWNLPDMDFTQTHFYVSSPTIESVLGGAAQSYIAKYKKPTLNGEFGLTTDGNGLAAQDPKGIHIHNAIWGSTFSGAMGSAMTWWWDNYINPQNLYYHFNPLATVVSQIHFKEDNYTKTTANTTGGGASDIIISPGADFSAATASLFTIDANGGLTPRANQLGRYLFGSVFNQQYHNPPTFTVNYPVAGQFKVVTGESIGTSPRITISVDNVLLLDQNAIVNTTYTVNIGAGAHAIKVDNLGTDWTTISNYTFTNIGSPLTTYLLRSADNSKAVGWVLNSKYNWQYVKNSGVEPSPVSGSVLLLTGMKGGNYDVHLYSCSTGNLINTMMATVSNGQLSMALPDITWDLSFIATIAVNAPLPVRLKTFYGEAIKEKNELHIDISQSENIKDIYMESSADGISFASLAKLNQAWASINGKHFFVDEHPIKGKNYYRLRFTDQDGTMTYSNIVSITNNRVIALNVYPNPFKNFTSLRIEKGKYQVTVADKNGRLVDKLLISGTETEREIKLSLANLISGMYFLNITDLEGNRKLAKKIIKE